MNDPELEILRRYRHARPAPAVDVADRVVETIRGLPTRSRQAERWTMAACAAVCAGAAALLLVAAMLRPGQVSNSTSAFDLVIDAQDIDVQSLMQ